jgi:hypothetical protein
LETSRERRNTSSAPSFVLFAETSCLYTTLRAARNPCVRVQVVQPLRR